MLKAEDAKKKVDSTMEVFSVQDVEDNIERSCSLGLSNTYFCSKTKIAGELLKRLTDAGYNVSVETKNNELTDFEVEW